MNLLAIDSVSSVLSVAVSREEEIFLETVEAGMKHSELVMDIINKQMEKAGLKPDDLNGVLCMGGPGSFTGLRIGFSIAKGLALSLSIPFAPVPTLECIAYKTSGLTIPVIKARKDAFFFAMFENGKRVTEDADGDTNQIAAFICDKSHEKSRENEKILITGPDADELYNTLPPDIKHLCESSPKNTGYAKELILIAKDNKLFNNDNTAFLYSGPEYIRKTDAEINLSR